MTTSTEASETQRPNKSRILIVSAFVVVIGLIVTLVAARKEPTFEGRTAREWARELPNEGALGEASPALKALLKMGPAGFSEAARLLRPEASLIERFSEWAHPRSPAWLRGFLPPRPVSAETRAAVARGLDYGGMLAAGQIPALGRALRDPDRNVRERAAIALWHFGPLATNASAALVEALRHPDEHTRSLATLALSEAKPPLGTMPTLVGLLSSPVTCANGARALGAFGPTGSNAQPHLIARLRHSYEVWHPVSADPVTAQDELNRETQCRYRLAEAIGKIGTGAEQAVPALEPALKDTNTFVHAAAAVALGKFGPSPAARGALPQLGILLDRLESGNLARTRADVTFAMWRIDPSHESRLTETFLKPNFDYSAVLLIEAMGPAAKSVLPAMQAGLRDGALNSKVNRAVAIWRISGETNGVLEVVTGAARDPTNAYPHFALLQWCRMQPESPEPMEALIRLAGNQDAQRRQDCLQIFARLGPVARPALPFVKRWLADSNYPLRDLAGKTWLAIAPDEVAALMEK